MKQTLKKNILIIKESSTGLFWNLSQTLLYTSQRVTRMIALIKICLWCVDVRLVIGYSENSCPGHEGCILGT